MGLKLALAMNRDDGQHIAADNGRVGVVCGMVEFVGNEFIVGLCPRDSTVQSICGLIQKGQIKVLQIP